MQATLEVTDLIKNTDQTLEQTDELVAADRIETLAPVQLAYVGGGTGAVSVF
jgi:hypothetical protein